MKQQLFTLRRVGFDVERGECLSVYGPSGSGKSSLISVLALIETAWSGEYFLDGVAVHALSSKQRAAFARDHVSTVYSKSNLINNLSIRENIELPLFYRHMPSRLAKSLYSEVLERFDLVSYEDERPSGLPRTIQQKISLARALVHRPSLLLLDEAESELIPPDRVHFSKLVFEQVQDGTTIIRTEQPPGLGISTGRALTLDHGWMIQLS